MKYNGSYGKVKCTYELYDEYLTIRYPQKKFHGRTQSFRYSELTLPGDSYGIRWESYFSSGFLIMTFSLILSLLVLSEWPDWGWILGCVGILGFLIGLFMMIKPKIIRVVCYRFSGGDSALGFDIAHDDPRYEEFIHELEKRIKKGSSNEAGPGQRQSTAPS